MSKRTDHRREKVIQIKKGKVSGGLLKSLMKYDTTMPDREYILSKLSASYTDLVYNNPLPNEDLKICQERAIINTDSNIIQELNWIFDTLIKFSIHINQFLILEKQIEIFFLLSKNAQCFDILNLLDDKVCHSVFAINIEFLLNEIDDNSLENIEILKEISEEEIEAKLFITLQLDKLRIEKKFTSWQYDAIVTQEKLNYSKDLEFVDYINFKYDPIFQNTDERLDNIHFILGFESDFSVIDRYKSLKKVIPFIISQNELDEQAEKLFFERVSVIADIIEDPYWKKLSLLGNNSHLYKIPSDNESFYIIQDYYFVDDYDKVKTLAKEILASDPNSSEIYLFFVKALIMTNARLGDYISENTQLYILLDLIKSILEKGKNYLFDRQRLLDYYYTIAHFKFSQPILEFLVYEYNFSTTNHIVNSSILNINPIRYNFFNAYNTERIVQNVKPQLLKYQTYNFLFSDEKYELKGVTFFSKKMLISKEIVKGQYCEALKLLQDFSILEKQKIEDFEFIRTWTNRRFLKCYIELQQFSEFADLIVDNYFKKDFAYDHYFNEDISEVILECENEEINKNISIPILFQIYNQQQTTLYDSIANFLIANSLFLPSELFDIRLNFNNEKLIHFFEKVCTKENIEDSPYINTIEEVENERILILNYLKILNPIKTDYYNEEILKITTESSIRIGLLQIHESRIYVDTLNIFKIVENNALEVFDRYLSLTDTNLIDITSIKLNENYSKGKVNLPYYFQQLIDEQLLPFYELANNPQLDDNVVFVPQMRYVYFTTIFNTIKQLFIFDESYGFKGFLSMRIRHGTFSNVLRSVFDNHKLVSSLEANSFEYKNVRYWEEKFSDVSNSHLIQIQELLKNFSREVDRIIEEGLLWINVQSKENPSISAIFDFEFSTNDIKFIFINRMGRIKDFNEFVNVAFDILYEKLESNLVILRGKISDELTPQLVSTLELLNQSIQNITGLPQNKKNLIGSNILSCKTDIQIITTEINNWFKISYNKSIEEFPLEMILKSSLKYIDIINKNAFTKGTVKIEDNSISRFNGKYFESFGDIFINLFDNIISKNRDLGEDLLVEIDIREDQDILTILVKNNLSHNLELTELSKSVQDIINKINEYEGDSPVAFEKGSGYLKICKSIYVGLNQKDYTIIPTFDKDSFEVTIKFNIKDLTV
ncbi:hypothetical protein [Flavobacterium soli]|uniref:hypothetical protein n=1 Tax=Flavobacterium soli TaxID=344881 RepID=UPI000478CFB5|nr:hypothetical protein [Flavobacterium soli]